MQSLSFPPISLSPLNALYINSLPLDYKKQRLESGVVQGVASYVHNEAGCLLMRERREHAETLAALLAAASITSIVLHGGMRVRERQAAEAQLHKAQVIVATGKYIGEGFDLPRLDTLFLALPIALKGTLSQYAGRIHRAVEGKQEVTVYDYLDTGLPMLERMYRTRERLQGNGISVSLFRAN